MEGEAWMMGDLRWLIGAALRRRDPAAVLRNANREGIGGSITLLLCDRFHAGLLRRVPARGVV